MVSRVACSWAFVALLVAFIFGVGTAQASVVSQPHHADVWTVVACGEYMWHVDSESVTISPTSGGGSAVVVSLSDTSYSWSSGAVPLNPVCITGGSTPVVAIPLKGASYCEVVALDAAGDEEWFRTLDDVDCVQAGAADDHVFVVTRSATAGHAIALSKSTGAELDSVTLSGQPTSAPVVVKEWQSGGSGTHWLVGAGATVDLVEVDDQASPATVDVVDTLTTSHAEVTALAAAGVDHVVALARSSSDGAGTLGKKLFVVDVDWTSSPDLSEDTAVTLSAMPLTGPLAVVPCASNGGSGTHWYCVDEVVAVVAGSGWVNAIDMSDGASLFGATSVTGEVTGVALSADDELYMAGQRWVPPNNDRMEWWVKSFDPATENPSAAGVHFNGTVTVEVVTTSPLLTCGDDHGVLRNLVGSSLAELSASRDVASGPLAGASSRAYGDPGGTGAVTATCP